MSVIDIQLPDGREPGRTTSAYAWGPSYRAGVDRIVVDVEFFATFNAAFGGGNIAGKREISIEGRDYRNFVRRNRELVLANLAAIDVEIQRRHGGTIVPAELPPWAYEPEEPDPEPES